MFEAVSTEITSRLSWIGQYSSESCLRDCLHDCMHLVSAVAIALLNAQIIVMNHDMNNTYNPSGR